MEPTNQVVRWAHGCTLATAGRAREAADVLDRFAREEPQHMFARHGVFMKEALEGRRTAALAQVTAPLREAARRDAHFSWEMARCYALLDERDDALDWMRNAASLGFYNHPFLSRGDPLLEGLERDARYAALLREMEQRWLEFEP